jgi:hypothetical protein
MMKWRNTVGLVGLALALFGFIFFYERHTVPVQPALGTPPRLLPNLVPREVSAIQIRFTNLVIRAERNGDAWRLTAPLVYPAAPVAAERFLTTWQNAAVAAHLSPADLSRRGQKLSDFGLDKPQTSILLEQGGEGRELHLGAHTTVGDQVYAQIVGVPGISVVEAALLEVLPRSADDWRNLALVERGGGAFDQVEIIKPNGGMYLQRDPTNQVWQLSRPRLRADQFKVENLLDKIEQGRLTRFVTDDLNADLETYGLLPPALELVLGQGTNPLQRVQFGKSPPQDAASVYARRLDRTNVVLVPKTLLDLLHMPAAEYRDRRLLAFNPAAITQLEVRSDEPFLVRRQTNDTWLAGETTAVDTPFVRDWLLRLSQLQVSEFVKDVVTDFSGYGLAQPSRQYVLRTSVTNASGVTNLLVGELHFGSNTLEKVFVRRADEDSVYAVRYFDYLHMPATVWQLRDHRVWSFTTNQTTRVTLREQGRNRTFLRSPAGDWSLAPGSRGRVNPFALEEVVFRLGELTAPAWVARGEENLPRFGFAATNLQITVELRLEDQPQTLTLDFGGPSPTRFPYAAARLDGQVWIFEFPWALFSDLVPAFGLPLTEESPAPGRRDTSLIRAAELDPTRSEEGGGTWAGRRRPAGVRPACSDA